MSTSLSSGNEKVSKYPNAIHRQPLIFSLGQLSVIAGLVATVFVFYPVCFSKLGR